MAKTEVILTRGVAPITKKSLERLAKKKRLSLNSVMLNAIDYYLLNYVMLENNTK